MKRSELGSLLLAAASILVWSACGGSANNGGTTVCGDAGTCPAGMVCSSGICVITNTGGTGGVVTGGTGGVAATGGIGATGGFGGTGTIDPVAPGAQPPPAPSGPPALGAGSTVIAVDQLFLGDTDPNTGQLDSNAWRHIGYNLDGLISTKYGTNHCKPVEGATPSSVKTDGDNGIDNSFGENLVPILGSLTFNPSATVSQSLQDGSFTLLFRLDKLEDPAFAPDQTSIAAGYYDGAPFDALVYCPSNPSLPNCSPPKFDGTDQWPVTFESVNNGDINGPKLMLPASYLSGGTWVSGSQVVFTFDLMSQGFSWPIPITRAVFSMNISGSGAAALATNGVIAGVIPTEQLIASFKQVAGTWDTSLCSGATFDSIAQEFSQASDIMQDGSNGDPSKTCDGISIGIGFEGRAVTLGGVAPAAAPLPDPCAN
jgi:hypothetical protein